MHKKDNYIYSIHRLGRLGSIGAILIMLGIPTFIAYFYNIWPNFTEVILVSSGLLVLFVPLAVAEVVSFMPILGSASYISFITGNVLNLKLPVAVNAVELSKVKQGTEKSDVIITMAIAISSITTMFIIAIGVLLIVPLSPIFESSYIQTATTYMLPALFGGMFLPMFLHNKVGDYSVKGRLLPIILPLILITTINLFVFPLKGLEGIAMIVVIPLTIFIAYILFKKNIIKMTK